MFSPNSRTMECPCLGTEAHREESVDQTERSPLIVQVVTCHCRCHVEGQAADAGIVYKSTDCSVIGSVQDDGKTDSSGDHCHLKYNKSGIDKKARRKLIIASILCLIFMVGEIVGGVLAKSLAIATDAAHLLTDFASFMISLFSLYLASRPATKKMSFGWHRAEVMGALISVLLIWVVTGILVYMAVERVVNGKYEINATIMLITSGVGVAFNIIMGLTLHQSHSHSHGGGHSHSHAHSQGSSDVEKGEKENVNVRAAFIHVLGDFVQSLGVLTAALIIFFKPEYKIADPICTFIFSVLVLATTISILKDTLVVLMEGAPKGVDFNKVKESFSEIPGVIKIHDLRLWSITVNRTALSVHLAIDKEANAQLILSSATHMAREKFGISECTMQVEIYVDTMSDCTQCQDPQD